MSIENTTSIENKEIIRDEVRITLLHYHNKIVANYSPYYCPSKIEHRQLEIISYPKITRDLLEELRDENTTLSRVQDILKGL